MGECGHLLSFSEYCLNIGVYRGQSGRAVLVAGVMLIRNDNLAAPLPSPPGHPVMVRDSGVSDQ